jgi:hypothetical protein
MRTFGVICDPESSMSTECERIAHHLADTINGQAWYGDSLQQVLKGVNARQAQAHPIPNAHSTWELLRHVESWVKFALGAVEGVPIPAWPGMPVELDWPAVADNSESETAWKKTVDSFFSHHSKLVETVRNLSDERLEATVPGRNYNFYRLFHGTIQHAVYHAGQIVMLKKMTAQD